VLEVAIKSLTW